LVGDGVGVELFLQSSWMGSLRHQDFVLSLSLSHNFVICKAFLVVTRLNHWSISVINLH